MLHLIDSRSILHGIVLVLTTQMALACSPVHRTLGNGVGGEASGGAPTDHSPASGGLGQSPPSVANGNDVAGAAEMDGSSGGMAGSASDGTESLAGGAGEGCGGPDQACCVGIKCNSDSMACCAGTCVDILGSAQHCGAACQVCGGVRTICSAGACIQCEGDNDCSASRATCDANSHACVCRRPSPDNLVVNPGFDADLAGWGGVLATGEPSWSASDADGCPESGSVHGNNTRENTNFLPGQCIQVAAGTTYYFGALFKAATDNQTLALTYCSDTACKTQAASGPFIQIASAPTNWSPLAGTATPPTGVKSVLLSAGINNGEMDQIYFNAKSATY
jgi:hypothetical protein